MEVLFMYYENYQNDRRTSKAPNIKIILSLVVAAAIACAFICGNIFESDSVSEYYDNTLDCSDFVQPSVKNNIDLAKWAQMACDNGWGYVYGTFGYVLSEQMLDDKLAQYPAMVGENESFIRQNWLGRRTADCMGLIKSYMWYSPDSNSIIYNGGSMPDIGCDRLFEQASVKGTIDTIPETVGLAVWAEGHIGIYIGDGYAIEAQSTRDGVKKTKLRRRNWTHWFEIPYIQYNYM